jgi:Interferon-related developmental regulator (IFRD)
VRLFIILPKTSTLHPLSTMSSLRRQAMDHRKKLESSKTVSRKAKARLETSTSSPILSAQNSRPTSRAPSRTASHGGAGDSRPGSQHGSAPGSTQGSRAASPSGSATLHSSAVPSEESDDFDDTGEISGGIEHFVETMKDRDFFKGSSETRAQVLRSYANMLCQTGAEDSEDQLEEMVPILIRCIHKDSGDTARHALRAIAATSIICENINNLFTSVRESIMKCLIEAESAEVKVSALQTFGATAFFGGASSDQVETTMGFLMHVVQSDGEYVDETDNAEVVCTAIDQWAFLSTLLEPDETTFHIAVEAFSEQLDSSAPEVLLAAANAIGLLSEQQYVPRKLDAWNKPVGSAEDRAELATNDPDHDLEAALLPKYQQWAWSREYAIFQGLDAEVRSKVREIAASSMRKTRKDVRRELHAVARDVLHTLEHPWRGPRFSTALVGEGEGGQKWLGHRLVKSGLVIDRWWKLHRYNAIRRVLQGGIQVHLEGSSSVAEALRDELMPTSRFRKSVDGEDEDELVQDRLTNLPEDDESDEE